MVEKVAGVATAGDFTFLWRHPDMAFPAFFYFRHGNIGADVGIDLVVAISARGGFVFGMREGGARLPVSVNAYRRDFPGHFTVAARLNLMAFAAFLVFPEQGGCGILVSQFIGAIERVLYFF